MNYFTENFESPQENDSGRAGKEQIEGNPAEILKSKTEILLSEIQKLKQIYSALEVLAANQKDISGIDKEEIERNLETASKQLSELLVALESLETKIRK